MKCLIVVDVQNGFVSSRTEMILPRLEQLMTDFSNELIIATQFINVEESGFTNIMHWGRLKTAPETDVVPFVAEKAKEIVQKTTYSACNETVVKLLKDNNVTEVYLAGIDTDCCVLATAIELFDRNIRPIVLTQYCASNGGKKSHNAAITVLERTIGRAQINMDLYAK